MILNLDLQRQITIRMWSVGGCWRPLGQNSELTYAPGRRSVGRYAAKVFQSVLFNVLWTVATAVLPPSWQPDAYFRTLADTEFTWQEKPTDNTTRKVSAKIQP